MNRMMKTSGLTGRAIPFIERCNAWQSFSFEKFKTSPTTGANMTHLVAKPGLGYGCGRITTADDDDGSLIDQTAQQRRQGARL